MQIGDDLQPLAPQQLNTALPQPVQNMATALMGGAQHLFNLPQRFMEASEQLRQTGEYDAGPGAELMQLLATGGMGGVERGAAGVFGGKLAGASKPGLRLERVGEPETNQFSDTTLHHRFNMVDADGRVVGNMRGASYGDNHFYVSSIHSNVPGKEYSDPRALGTGNIRSIIESLRTHFPNLEGISGTRISGARKAAGVVGEGPRGWDVSPATGRGYSQAFVKLPKAPGSE